MGAKRSLKWTNPRTALQNAAEPPKRKRRSRKATGRAAMFTPEKAAEPPKSRKPRAPGGKRAPKKTAMEKFIAESRDIQYVPTAPELQLLEILETYTKSHILTCEPWVLRELLRSTHKSMNAGPAKKKIRGILAYFTRTKAMVTWSKISQVLQGILTATDGEETFVGEREIPYDRVVDDTKILQMAANPRYEERIELIDTKIQALKRGYARDKAQMVGNANTTADFTEEMPTLEDIPQGSQGLFGSQNISY